MNNDIEEEIGDDIVRQISKDNTLKETEKQHLTPEKAYLIK